MKGQVGGAKLTFLLAERSDLRQSSSITFLLNTSLKSQLAAIQMAGGKLDDVISDQSIQAHGRLLGPEIR